MKFVMYGAGNVGRGFIAPLFSQAGYDVGFIDINKEVINELNRRREYEYCIASGEPRRITVRSVSGIDGSDEKSVAEAVSSCDIMAVSLGAAALERVAPLIAKGLLKRWAYKREPLNILICENLKDSAALLSGWISAALPPQDRPGLSGKCGFVEAAIGRMIPVAIPVEGDPLLLSVEEYGFLPVDKDAFIGDIPNVPGLVAHSPFAFYEERKLYLHNMGHAVCAYLGLTRGHKFIWQSIADPVIRLATMCAMTESAATLSARYQTPFHQVFDHAEDLLLRFTNKLLGDTCERVGRDPMRKLAAGDRLAGPLSICGTMGIHPVYIAVGFAAALVTSASCAEEARRIVASHSGLTENQSELVLMFFELFKRCEPLEVILQEAERQKGKLRGAIV